MKLYPRIIVLLILWSLSTLFNKIYAAVKMPTLFTDHMVLQRGKPVPVWGWANAGEKVTVTFDGQTKSTVATADGKWMVQLDPLKLGNPREMIISGENTILIKDVLVGEVWVCSGQSNMEWALFKCIGADEAIANSNNPDLRIFNVPHRDTYEPFDNIAASWVYADPKTVKNISAVGYWFLSKLQKQLGVPVGFIEAAYGGTVIESWISKPVLESIPNRDKYTYIDSVKKEYDVRVEKMRPVQEKYDHDRDSAKRYKLPPPPVPNGLVTGSIRGPSMLFNGEIFPLIPYAISGVAWYQGESNAYVGRANSYAALLPALIKQWRADWHEEKLPFVIFQITPNRKPQTDANEKSGIALVQEAELKTCLQTPYTALVTTMDVAETNVHYLNKEPVGERAMKAALAIAYHKDVEYTGPIFKSMKLNGNTATIDFTHLGGGLTMKGDTLLGFAMAGADKRFFFANAVIKGNTVVVSCPEVSDPVSVRYGWADYPRVNLFNKEGIPASPFRTDNWPIK
jgi:sialate O-acetylesterase